MKPDNLLNRNTELLIEQYGDSGFSLLNKKTGEYQDIPYQSNFNLPLNKKQIEYLNNNEKKFKAKEIFVKVYKDPIVILGKELSNRDFAWFMRLIPYINKSDCILMNNECYLNVKQISELLDVNYDNAKTVFRNFEKLGLIGKIERQSQKDIYKTNKVLVVNPYIFFNGQDLSKDVFEKFKDSRWAILNKSQEIKE